MCLFYTLNRLYCMRSHQAHPQDTNLIVHSCIVIACTQVSLAMSGATVRRQSLRRTEQAFSFKGEVSDEEEEERGSDDTGSESSGGKRRTKHKKGSKKGKGHDKGGKSK